MTAVNFEAMLDDQLHRYLATDFKSASIEEIYKAMALVLRDQLLRKKQAFNKRVVKEGTKRVYYLCMEFLIGRSLRNNLFNLGLEDVATKTVAKKGWTMDSLYELEADPGLGNGGLGRLASCFMDSLATCNYPAMGFSIRYEYGLFKQKIVENQQVELPDLWLDSNDFWMMPRSDKSFTVHLGGWIEEVWEQNRMKIVYHGGEAVEAMPYDLMVSGYDAQAVSVLRLWRASAMKKFDMQSFSQGDYMMAMRADNEAELISKVLYPSDDHQQGKQLRLSQQYFLVSASLQSILKDHLKNYGNLDTLSKKAAIHINDTHPALAIPELMRLLVDEHGFSWERAWQITTETIAYTNHTVLAEALEKWDEQLVRARLPRIYSILHEIDRRFCENVLASGRDMAALACMTIFGDGKARMANLSVIGSHSVNGVSALHSDIIKESVFKDFYRLTPEKFTNVTNGIAHRRWLCQSNPRLSGLITELIGEDFKTDAAALEGLLKYSDDKTVLQKLAKIKAENKKDFAAYLLHATGQRLNPESRIDTQIKRLHEYKRQLLNVMKIIDLWLQLSDNPNMDFTPQTFVFGAKAAGGYYHAKRIISLINCISQDIKKDAATKDKLDVIFIENYNVTKAEHLIPASEISEQISLAGKEASGTSNMKFMLNGALTLGTVDGANVEIGESVGEDNIFFFGLLADEVEKLWHSGYYATNIYTSNERLRRVVDRLRTGFGGQSFADIATYLVVGSNTIADPYMCLKDFDSYIAAHNKMDGLYKNADEWNKKALINIAKSGIFAADRSIKDYADNIWGLKRLDAENVKSETAKSKNIK